MADYLDTLIGQVARTVAEEEEQEDFLDTIINEVVTPPKPKSSDPDPIPEVKEPEAAPDTPEFTPKLFGPKAPTAPIAAPKQGEGMSLREWVAAGNDPEAHHEFISLEDFAKGKNKEVADKLRKDVANIKDPSRLKQVAKRDIQSLRKGTADIGYAIAAQVEQEQKPHVGQYISPTLNYEAMERAKQKNPDDPRSVYEESLQEIRRESQEKAAKAIRVVSDIVHADVDPQKGFEGGFLGDLEDVSTSLFEYAPAMITTAISGPIGLAVTYEQMFGSKFEESIKKGDSKEIAFTNAALHAGLGTPAEFAGNVLQIRFLKQIGKNLGVKNVAGKFIQNAYTNIRNALTAGVGEMGEETIQAYTEAYAEVVSHAPAGATQEQIMEVYKQHIATPAFEEARKKGQKLGFMSGTILVGAGGVVQSTFDGATLAKNLWKKYVPLTEEQNLRARVGLLEKEDFDAESTEALDSGMDQQAVENQQEKLSEVAKATAENQEEVHQAQIKQAEKEVEKAKQAEQENKQAATEQAAKIEKAKTKFVQTLQDPIAVMEIAADMDVKPINDAHKALSTGEDSIKKLKGIEYDLKHGKELKDQPFEVQAVAAALKEAVNEHVNDLSIFEAAETQAKEDEKAEKEAEKTAKAIEREAEKAKKETEKVIDETAKEQESLVSEIEKVSEQFEKEQEAKEAKVKAAEEKKIKPSYRRKAQRKAAGISEAKSKSLDQAFAEQRRKAAEKREAAPKKPADLKAALRFSDGTILTGTSHFAILDTLTEAQHEEVAKQTVDRGFDSKQDGFKSVDEATTAYGVTKSEQLKLKTTSKEFIAKAEKLGKEVKDKKQLKTLIEERIAKKSKKLNLGNMKVVETLDDLKGVISAGALAEAKELGVVALYNPADKTSYVIADQHRTLVSGLVSAWHELGHQKLAALAAATEVDLTSLWDTVEKQNPERIKKFMSDGLDRNRAAEEILIETYEATKNPTVASKLKAVLSKIAAKLGFPVNEMGPLDGIIQTMKTAIFRAGALSELKEQFLTEAQRFEMNGVKDSPLTEKPVVEKTGGAVPKNWPHPIRYKLSDRQRGTLDKNSVAFIEAYIESMPAAYKEHFGVVFAPKEAGTSVVRLKKMGELRQDAKHIVTLYKDADVGHFLEEFGYFAARRLLKKGEAKGLYNEWLKTKPKDVKKPKDWQRWFATSYSEWYLGHNVAPTKGLTKAFQKITTVAKAIYLRLKGYATKQTEVQSMFEDIATGQRDIVSDKYFYSDKNVMDRYLFGVVPNAKDRSTQGFSKNNKTYWNYDPGNICPKTEAFAGWLMKEFEAENIGLKDLTEIDMWVQLTNQAREEGVDVPCSYCYVEQNRRNAVILHNEGKPKTRIDYEKVKTMITAIPYKDYLIQKNVSGKNKGKYTFSDEMVAEANLRGGLRLFSFSDYIRGAHRAQMELMLEHAKMRGLSIKAITKRPEFVEDFARTGITINVSIDTEGTGMDHSTAYALAKKHKNVHVRTVAKNPKHLVELNKDKRVGVITLFHGDRANTPEGYENMNYKSASVKEILAENPELVTKTCCLNQAKCFNGKLNTQCQANCGNGMGNLSIPDILTGEEAKANAKAIQEANLIKPSLEALEPTITEKAGKAPIEGEIAQPVAADALKYMTKAQQDWFKGSAVVDEAGSPLEVYHGTPYEFEQFKATEDIGFHFGTLEQAQNRIKKTEGQVKTFYLNIKNPYVMEVDPGQWDDNSVYKALKDVEDLEGDAPFSFIDWLDQNGYDGVKYQNKVEGEGYSYIALDANQMKLTSNFAPQVESLKFSMRKTVKDQVTPAQWEKLKHLGIKHKSFGQKVASVFDNIGAKIAQALADPLVRLKQLQDKKGGVKSGEDSYLSFNMITNFTAIFRSFLYDGRLDWKHNWVQYNKADKKVGGLMNVFENLGSDAEMFMYRMMGKSAQEMLNKGRKNLFGTDGQGKDLNDQEVINNLMESTQKLYDKNTKGWEEAEARLKEINKSVLDIMEQGGLINEATRAEWERETYIPFFRVMDDIKGTDVMILHPGTPAPIRGIHKLAGGRENVADPLQNLIGAYAQGIHAALKNTSRLKAIKLLNELGLAEPTTDQAGPLVVDVKIKGKTHYWHVHDKMAFNAIMAMDDMTQGAFSSIVTAPKRWLTFAVTQNPAFRLANWFRDSITTATLEKEFIPIWDSLIGMYHAAFNTETFKEYKSTGGAFTGAYHQRDILSSQAKGIASLRKEAVRGKRITPFRKGDVKGIIKQTLNPMSWLDLYNKMGDVSENAARVGLYRKKRAAGRTAQQAGFAAKDLLDFHRTSSNKMLRTFIHTVPFLNARIQGLYKLGREGTDLKKGKAHLANFYLTSAMIGMLSIGNHLLYRDDDRYKGLTDDEKWYYFHFYDLPGIPGHVQIPSPFEIGTIAGKLPVVLWERLVEQRTDNDEVKRFLEFAFMDMFGFNPLPQAVKPIVQQYMNRDFFTDAPIVPRRLQGIDPDLVWDRRTSVTARALGEAAKAAGLPEAWQEPIRIEKLFKDYFSYLGVATFQGTDLAYDWITNAPDDPLDVQTLKYLTGVGRFYKGTGPAKRTKYDEKFWDLATAIDKAHKSMNHVKKESGFKAKQVYRKKHKHLLDAKFKTEFVKMRLRTLKTQENRIYNSTKPVTQKRKELDILQRKRNELMRVNVEKINKLMKQRKEQMDANQK